MKNICWIFRHRGVPALCKVASRGHLNIAKVLLERGAAAEYVAAFRRLIEFVRLLLNKIDSSDSRQWHGCVKPLLLVAVGRLESVRLLSH